MQDSAASDSTGGSAKRFHLLKAQKYNLLHHKKFHVLKAQKYYLLKAHKYNLPHHKNIPCTQKSFAHKNHLLHPQKDEQTLGWKQCQLILNQYRYKTFALTFQLWFCPFMTQTMDLKTVSETRIYQRRFHLTMTRSMEAIMTTLTSSWTTTLPEEVSSGVSSNIQAQSHQINIYRMWEGEWFELLFQGYLSTSELSVTSKHLKGRFEGTFPSIPDWLVQLA